MNTRYNELTELEKLLLVIDYVEREIPLPIELVQFLKTNRLYQAITNPKEI